MTHVDTISTYILDKQIELFEAAAADLQISFAEMARRAGLVDTDGKPSGTLKAWVIGRNALSLWGMKRLLRVKGNNGEPQVLAPYLSRLFEPEECALVRVAFGEVNHDDLAGLCRDYTASKDAFHHPDSEEGREIGPTEDANLRSKATRLKLAA